MTYESTVSLEAVLSAAEAAESALANNPESGLGRHGSGSYYTPADVTAYFWRQYFEAEGVQSVAEAVQWLTGRRLVEPAVGAGALVFGLFRHLSSLGVSMSAIALVRLDVYDINATALAFFREQISLVETQHGVVFQRLSMHCANFLDGQVSASDSPTTVFGNPPFVRQRRQSSRWKNTFADFLETAVCLAADGGAVQLILPLSIAFSRDYRLLRARIRQQRWSVNATHFDNIPDTLFESGKSESTNTNHANSQRCTILTLRADGRGQCFTTGLQRWSREQRPQVLGVSPRYLDATGYDFDDQIPRPLSQSLLQYLEHARDYSSVNSLCAASGEYVLYVAGVARNYIGFRNKPGSGTHQLSFASQRDRLRGLVLLSSNLFMDYWLSVGDGFHITRQNILRFPVHPKLLEQVDSQLANAERIWRRRSQFGKTKKNCGQIIESYDFSDQFKLSTRLVIESAEPVLLTA